MEIKDIVVTVDGEDVRGGSDILQIGAQLGLNTAIGEAYSAGVFNQTENVTAQDAGQKLGNSAALTDVVAVERLSSIKNSVLGRFGGPVMTV
ncbi:MAG TPA: hypothetical protein VF210_18540 [Pseudomonadales bacterium]